ncbi:sulfite exporter TauE/SafE family protein [Candidatus Borrarchaeum sp.]|uniref:sulfite exporter TauE/SafE family protein n=1 Tax=Candidatus Borrarchaeum sp. TaxID=2846742 RepID=UPI00257FBC7D|nr:sulfite exporter TauE/SafE family protein [Candidatus Borrarchaeum sp.]
MADLMIILYALAGIGVGFIAALLGLGGGFIMVPLLNLVFGIPIRQSIGTSLFTIVFTSSSSSVEYVRKRVTDLKLGAMMIPFTITGAVIGANVSVLIPEDILKAIFGVVLFIASVRMFLKKNNKDKLGLQSDTEEDVSGSKFLCVSRICTEPDGTQFEYTVSIPLIALFGFCAGLVSGLLGVGGGIIQVPVLNLIFGIPIHIAIATSLFIIIFTSSFGMTTHLLLGNVILSIGVLLAIGTVIGGQIGARAAQKIERRKLRKIFAILMAFAGIRMFISLFAI